jgi:hypothetical protein
MQQQPPDERGRGGRKSRRRSLFNFIPVDCKNGWEFTADAESKSECGGGWGETFNKSYNPHTAMERPAALAREGLSCGKKLRAT